MPFVLSILHTFTTTNVLYTCTHNIINKYMEITMTIISYYEISPETYRYTHTHNSIKIESHREFTYHFIFVLPVNMCHMNCFLSFSQQISHWFISLNFRFHFVNIYLERKRERPRKSTKELVISPFNIHCPIYIMFSLFFFFLSSFVSPNCSIHKNAIF